MATTAQGDPRNALVAYLADKVQLTPGARQLLDGLLQDVDLKNLESPADLAQAYESMDRLAANLRERRSLSGEVNAQMMQMSLRDLCPLFPFC